MEREDDVQLIHSVLSGDNAAFNALVKKYEKGVHALAWRKVGDFHYAEEITQDTFLRAYQNLSTLRNPNQFPGWLYVIANRLCLNWIRKQKPVMQLQSLEDTPMEEVDRSAYTRYVLEKRETEATEHRFEIVKRLLEQLPESERTVMTLHYLGEMTTKEIGKFLGVSVGTIRTRLHRARKRLQEDQELLIQEVLGGVQIPANISQNIMRQIADMKPSPTQAAKPLLPWAAFGAVAVLVLLLIGVNNQHLIHFQRPYSFEATSEPTIEIVEALTVLESNTKPALRNQVGRTVATDGKVTSNGLQFSESVSTSKAPMHPADTEAWMPDPALRAAVREVLGMPADALLTKDNMQGLQRLILSGRGIMDIKGLEFAENLGHLHLGDEGNYVTDLSPLATLTSLTYLNVGANQVADLRPLTNLTNLTGLSLWHNQVTDISPLSSLTSLTYLNLADNYVSDLSPLANLINLEILDLFDNEIVSLGPLTDLKNIKHLILTENHIKDFSPISGLMNLQILWIKENPITDLRPLSELNLTDLKYDAVLDPTSRAYPSETWIPDAGLRAAVRGELGLLPDVPLTKKYMQQFYYLDAHDLGISDITGLEFASNLRELHLSKNPITDLRPLSNLTTLENLHLWALSPNTPTLDLQPLATLTNLAKLSLANSRVSDVRPLSGLKQLRSLHLSHNHISDIRPLAGLTQLWTLSLEGNPITDFTPLAGLNLEEFNISNNPTRIADISLLAELKQLRSLDLSNNDISDLRPLSGLTQLQTLWLKGNPITDFTPLVGLDLTDLKYDVVEQLTPQTDLAEIWMPDPALRTAVRGEIGLLPGVSLTKEKLQVVNSINVAGKGISDITGLEFATNLKALDISRNPITDLRPLANLVTLERLHLSNASPSTENLDLRPLAILTNLEELSLVNSRISDISALSGLKQLRSLNLSHNHILDLRPLARMMQLRTLLIQGNPITDFTPLAGLYLTDLK